MHKQQQLMTQMVPTPFCDALHQWAISGLQDHLTCSHVSRVGHLANIKCSKCSGHGEEQQTCIPFVGTGTAVSSTIQ